MRGKNGAAALLLTLAVTLGIVIPVSFLMLEFVRQAGDLLTRVSGLAARYQIERPEDLLKIPALGRIVQWIDEKTPIAAAELQQWLINAAKSALEHAVSGGRQILLGAVGAVIGLLLWLFILYFFFRDGDSTRARPAAHSHGGRPKGAAVGSPGALAKAVVFGALATALVQGARGLRLRRSRPAFAGRVRVSYVARCCRPSREQRSSGFRRRSRSMPAEGRAGRSSCSSGAPWSSARLTTSCARG
jgi:predicted PurR-regulated permease PerM